MMLTRIPATPPKISKIAADVERPLISIMIPTYNCIHFLRQTLLCVLAQDEGKERMQIEVIDDHSTDGDVQALVQEIGQGRVGFYRQPENVGSLRNFETCINRATGHYIHLLHGDDMVQIGFYKKIESLFKKYPECGAAFVGHIVIDEHGNTIERKNNLNDIVPSEGIIPNWLFLIAQKNRLQPPAKVVKRSVYEDLGGFYAVHFGEDWEMWVRIATKYPVCYSSQPLAMYRVHANNITSKSILSGQNIKDLTTVINIIKTRLPDNDKKKIIRQTHKNTSKYIAKTAGKILKMHYHPKAALTQAKAALKMSVNRSTVYLVIKAYLKIGWFVLKNKPKKNNSTKEEIQTPIVELPLVHNIPASTHATFKKAFKQ